MPQRATAASVGSGRRATSVPKRPRALLNETGSRAARPPSGARTSAARAPAWWEAEPRRSACSSRGGSTTAALVRPVVRPRPLPVAFRRGRHRVRSLLGCQAQVLALPVGVVELARQGGHLGGLPAGLVAPAAGRCRRSRPGSGRWPPPRPARRCLRTRPGPPGPAPGAGRSGRGGRRGWRPRACCRPPGRRSRPWPGSGTTVAACSKRARRPSARNCRTRPIRLGASTVVSFGSCT